mmetsp:Transcript_33970/g.78324  ORF Transcript_33970/g.78324 Transcript_33970/m.78324 type:complete len:204 (+) Transcript_33970:845-1456(+)
MKGSHTHMTKILGNVGWFVIFSFGFGRWYDKCMRSDGNVSVQMTSQINLDHITFLKRFQFLTRKRRVVADNVIYGNTYRKGNPPIHEASIDFLGVQLACLSFHDGRAKPTQIDNPCSHHTLPHQSLQCQIDNLARFLILGAHCARTQIGHFFLLFFLFIVSWILFLRHLFRCPLAVLSPLALASSPDDCFSQTLPIPVTVGSM